ncbi:MAG: ABC transporter ATP-binding protein [Acidovorax soli]|uniref:ABC transporter ATP-binding protein n=1 Tax=Acidovorax soli TaxID=592050 RepID=UPI0026E9D21B|nr:ABC transporter ATP-binding protein [Acidovorax soli]MCM2347139.1 ABC transporter ATP-binding protein [Acidovorax soli]
MSQALLSVSGLSVSYGKKVAVSNASLRVEPGECVALIGTNGAGKSSLLKTISGVQAMTSGYVEFNGENRSGWDTATAVRNGLILCPEGRQIFPRMSVLDNITLGAFQRRLSKHDLHAELSKLEALFPILYERRQQEVGTLSGGEQQMVAIARALMGAPKLLLLDEPSLGLSPIMTDKLFETIRAIVNQGCSILIAEQNVYSTLKCSTRAYVVESGVVSDSYTSDEVVRDPRLLLSLLGQ